MTGDTIDEESLRDLQARTAKLPREIEPPADAWAKIKAEMDRTRDIGQGVRASRVIALWQRPAFLAAAALLLVAGSSVITAVSLSRRNEGNDDVTATRSSGATDRPVASRGVAPATFAEFTLVENDYISTANRLSAILESGESQLSPETIAKLRESLRVIDAAILEARRALAADPANKQLIEMLSTSYSQKVDLLRRTTEMGRS
ncbi:MAG: hypothetical protein ABI556_14045 [Gemmatimonadales bacterium]